MLEIFQGYGGEEGAASEPAFSPAIFLPPAAKWRTATPTPVTLLSAFCCLPTCRRASSAATLESERDTLPAQEALLSGAPSSPFAQPYLGTYPSYLATSNAWHPSCQKTQ